MSARRSVWDAINAQRARAAAEAIQRDIDQAQIDIGDDMYEQSRYDDQDIDITPGTEDDPATRWRG